MSGRVVNDRLAQEVEVVDALRKIGAAERLFPAGNVENAVADRLDGGDQLEHRLTSARVGNELVGSDAAVGGAETAAGGGGGVGFAIGDGGDAPVAVAEPETEVAHQLVGGLRPLDYRRPPGASSGMRVVRLR